MHKIVLAAYKSPIYMESIQLRNEILRLPLNLDIANEDLSQEINQIHFVASKNNLTVGVVVLIPNHMPKVGKLRQMATAENVRGEGYGIALVKALELYAKEQHMHTIQLNARHYAVGFYKKLGYTISSEAFEEVGIEHYQMSKKLV